MSDLAISLALGGDCLGEAAPVRSEPAVYGPVASDPTISRLISLLAGDAPGALKAIDIARAEARAPAWVLAGKNAPNHRASVEQPLVVDVDVILVTAHSDKENAQQTVKKGCRRPPVGTETTPPPALHDPRNPRPRQPPSAAPPRQPPSGFERRPQPP